MKKLKLITSLLVSSSLYGSVPTFSDLEIKTINGNTSVTQIEAGEAIQITLKNVNEGSLTDTKRKVYASTNGVKGQGVFGLMSKDSFLWQSPKIAGTYSIGGYVENKDGISTIVSKDIIVKTPFIQTSGRNNCPINFVFVPNSQGLHSEAKGWCIMKYEASPFSTYSGLLQNSNNSVSYNLAKAGSEYSTSKPKNPVYLNGSLANAKERCSAIKDSSGNILSNGSLVSIDVWTELVKNLYKTDYNWTEGAVNGGNIFIGHTDSNPNNPIMPSDLDTDGYYLTNNTSSDVDLVSSSQRRIMKTSYGDFIWDITGNVREYFRENYSNSSFQAAFLSFTTINSSTGVVGVSLARTKINTDYIYEDPKLLTSYKKLAPYNILGFKPSMVSYNYYIIAGGSTQAMPGTVMSNIQNYSDNTATTNYINNQTTSQAINSGFVYSQYSLKELGIGGYNAPNATGVLGYGTGLGNPILYGGDYTAATANNFVLPYGAQASFFSNTGLLAVNSGTDYTNATLIINDTTAANVGFRCMVPAN